MFNENSILSESARIYQITVEGKIDPSWSNWLNDMELISRKESDGKQITILTGALYDQVALRGLLNRLWDLNLVVRSVQQVESKCHKKE
jgi:hypothetical protein